MLVHLYLDGGVVGKNVSKRARSTGSQYVDESSLYSGYGDLNDCLCKATLPQDKSHDLS
jgi:hypothetical protein